MTEQIKHQEYRVLARKYRPQTFRDLIGQEMLAKILTSISCPIKSLKV